jgi:hypothetical protein
VEPLMAEQNRSSAVGAPEFGSTARKDEAKATVTRTTITPAPGTVVPAADTDGPKRVWRQRGERRSVRGELGAARPPYEGTNALRIAMTLLLAALSLITVGGAILMLLLWQQDREAGVLTTQLDRTWDLFDTLRSIERWVAFAVVPVAVAWIALATLNVRRATGQRRNPLIAGASLIVAVAGVWLVGDRIIARSDDWLGQAAGYVLQAVFLAIPLLALERVATSAEARRGALRSTYVISAVYLAHMQFLAGVSTLDETTDASEWGRLGAYLVIGALLQVLGALSANEGARAIEDGTEHRFRLRQRFGESLLAQAERGPAI